MASEWASQTRQLPQVLCLTASYLFSDRSICASLCLQAAANLLSFISQPLLSRQNSH